MVTRLLERLQPAQLVAHLVGGDAVKQVEQAVHGFADRKLIGDNDPGVLLAALQPVQVESDEVGGIVSQESPSFSCCVGQLLFVAQTPTLQVVRADDIEMTQPKRGGHALVDIFVEVEPNKEV